MPVGQLPATYTLKEHSVSMNVTRRFMDALDTLERYGDVDYIVSLFGELCDVGNAVSRNAFIGRDGAREYWTTYRAWFREVGSSFHNVIAQDGRSAIEWSSTGTSMKGHHVRYEGVSILEFQDDHIQRFRAYFNPEALGRAVATEHLLGDVYLWPFR